MISAFDFFANFFQKGVDICAQGRYNSTRDLRMWRNWQTRMVQVHMKAISWGFKSLHPHQAPPNRVVLFYLFSGAMKGFEGRVSENSPG